MADLPTTPDDEREAVLVIMALLNAWTYSEAAGGNVVVRAGWDTDEAIPAPSVIVTAADSIYTPGGADNVQDKIEEKVQLDCFARSQGEAASLQREVDAVMAANRTDPGGAGMNIFAFLLPENWIHNDALSRPENLTRRTMMVTLIRHRGQ